MGSIPKGIALTVALIVTATSPLIAQAHPAFSFPYTTVRVPVGATSASVLVIVEGTNLPVPPQGETPPTLEILDEVGEGPPGLTVTFSDSEERVGPVASTRRWRVKLTVAGMEPNTMLQRKASVRLGSVGDLADYTLDNKAAGEFTWEVAPPPQSLALGDDPPGRRTSLAVTTGARPATRIRIVQSSLQNEATKKLLGEDYLKLGDSGSVDIGARTTEGVVLEVLPTFTDPGTFTGSIVLAVDQASGTKNFPLTVHNSSFWRKVWGLVFIVAGIGFSLFLGVWAKNKANRLEARRSAAALTERLDLLEPTLEKAEKRAGADTVERMRKLQEDTKSKLSKKHLESERLLPRLWPLDTANPEKRAARFEAHLKKMAKRVAILDEIIARGVDEVLRRWGDVFARPEEMYGRRVSEEKSSFEEDVNTAFEKALRSLDLLADPAMELAKVQEGVNRVLSDLPKRAELGPEMLSEPAPRGTRQLTVELENLHAGVWFVWGAVTVVGGYYVLVLLNPGFGTPPDIIKCFFWGLGVQVAGQQLQQLSPAKIATQFALPVPSPK